MTNPKKSTKPAKSAPEETQAVEVATETKMPSIPMNMWGKKQKKKNLADGQYAITRKGSGKSLLETLRSMGVSAFKLPRLNVPAGSGPAVWSIETTRGIVSDENIKMIIGLAVPNQRTWNQRPFSQASKDPMGKRPSCRSYDGETGYGVREILPDGTQEKDIPKATAAPCATCKWNQFGSTRGDGNGKDCAENTWVLGFREDSPMPIFFSVPPASLGNFSSYLLGLLAEEVNPNHCITTLSLRGVKSAGGVEYYEALFAMDSELSDEHALEMDTVHEQLAGYIVSNVQAIDLALQEGEREVAIEA